nr:hypothetical protein [Streptomyces sp. MBT62]
MSSTYPPLRRSRRGVRTAPVAANTRRIRATCAYSAERDPSGGSSPHTRLISVSNGTARPASTAHTVRTLPWPVSPFTGVALSTPPRHQVTTHATHA